MFGTINNKHGERLDYTFDPGRADARTVVILGHGVTGNKDRPFIVALAGSLAAAGIPALRFSFSGNGASQGGFRNSTVSKEVSDLASVIDAVDSRGFRVAYAGHSQGGAVGVLAAAADPRISRLISLAGMVHTTAFAEREFGMVEPDHGCMWDNPACPLSLEYMADMKKIASVLPAVPRIRVPWLLVHGTADDVVPIQDSKDVFARAGGSSVELVELPGADHVFSGSATPLMIERVIEWLRRGI